MKKAVIFVYLLIFAALISAVVISAVPSYVSAYNNLHLNIQVTFSNGSIQAGTFAFVFNISSSSDCANANIVYSNSTTLTTDSRGIISYYLPNVTLDYQYQYWLCYYKSGVLTDTSELARVPYTFQAKNVTLSGIEADVNFDIGSYNITAGNLFGNLLWNYIQSFPYTHLANFTDNLGSRGYTNLLNFTNGPGFFNNILNFTGTLTNTKYCTYNSTDSKIHCDSTATVSETDPYWTGNQSLYFTKSDTLGFGYYNLTSFDINNYYLATNPFSFYNSTTLPAGTETLWNANYSIFLTHITWANAVNGTLLSQANYNTNYSTLYLSSNPFSFYNSTTLPASVETLWNANYSAFLTHITWANAINGTLFTTALYNTNYSTNDAAYRSITNTSYYLATNPFSFYNSTNFAGISGVGAFGYIPMWNGTSSVNNSNIFQLGNNVGIGTTNPLSILHIDSDSAASSVGVIIESNSSKSGSLSPRLGLVDAFSTNPGSSAPAWFIDNYVTDFRIFQKPNITTTSESVAFFIESTNNNVGIGTTSPGTKLDVNGTGATIIARQHTTTSYAGYRIYNDQNSGLRALEIDYSGSAYASSLLAGGPTGESAAITTTGAFPLVFGTSNTAKMTILSGGNVGIGTISPIYPLQIKMGGSSTNELSLTTTDWTTTVGSALIFGHGASTGNTYSSINAFAVGYGSASDLILNGNGGNVGIGTTAPVSRLSVGGVGSSTSKIYSTAGPSPTAPTYAITGSNTGVGTTSSSLYGVYGYASHSVSGSSTGVLGYGLTYDFYASGSGTDYGTSSSIRWKNNITEINPQLALNKVLKINGSYFNWNGYNNNTEHDMGFIAEDIGKVIPEVVEYETDVLNSSNWYIDSDGNKKLYATGVDYGALTPMLVQAIKGQQQIIINQNNTINDLKQALCEIKPELELCK